MKLPTRAISLLFNGGALLPVLMDIPEDHRPELVPADRVTVGGGH